METDEDLLEAARAGDQRALAALLERHEQRIYRFGISMCRDPEDAKDVLQDTLLAMARNVRDFRGASSVSTWLYTIARSFCIKRRRKRKHAPGTPRPLEDAASVADPKPAPDDAVGQKELAVALGEAIGALDPSQREVLILRDVEGLTAPEVAEIVGSSVDAVKSKLHRARLTVREDLARRIGTDTPPAATQATGRCPDVLTLFSRHLEGEISTEDCARMEQHIAGCAHCRGTCDSLKRILALCRTAPVTEVPEDVQRSVRSAVRQLVSSRR